MLVNAITEAARIQEAPLSAIFAHLDIIGASVNSAHQAKSGLSPRMFPEGVSVYTGHYHKPHTVPRTNITYIGSPFESALSPWMSGISNRDDMLIGYGITYKYSNALQTSQTYSFAKWYHILHLKVAFEAP